MKKSFVLTGLLTGIMALGAVVVSCSANVESGAKNELAGKSFSADFEHEAATDYYSFDFADDTFIITRDEEPYSSYDIKYCGNYRMREEETYSYTVNSEIGYIISKPTSLVRSYVRDGITLYTEPEAIPETLEAYKAERTKLFKALNPSITEEQISELLGEDSACTSVESFNKWKNQESLYREANKKFYEAFAYRLEGSKLILSEEGIDRIPNGLKFGDIFNDCYNFCYSSNNTNESGYSVFRIHVHTSTFTKTDSNIEISQEDDAEYTILSATNDSMTITKVTGWNNGYIEFDEAKAFTCPITYTDAEDKVTATITIDGKNYSFDIEYMTKEMIDEILDEYESATYTLQ